MLMRSFGGRFEDPSGWLYYWRQQFEGFSWLSFDYRCCGTDGVCSRWSCTRDAVQWASSQNGLLRTV